MSTALVARECKEHSVTCCLIVNSNPCTSQSLPLKREQSVGSPLSYLFVSLCSAKRQLPQHHPNQTSLASLERYDFFPAFTGDINESCSCLLIKTRPICMQTGMGGGLAAILTVRELAVSQVDERQQEGDRGGSDRGNIKCRWGGERTWSRRGGNMATNKQCLN